MVRGPRSSAAFYPHPRPRASTRSAFNPPPHPPTFSHFPLQQFFTLHTTHPWRAFFALRRATYLARVCLQQPCSNRLRCAPLPRKKVRLALCAAESCDSGSNRPSHHIELPSLATTLPGYCERERHASGDFGGLLRRARPLSLDAGLPDLPGSRALRIAPVPLEFGTV